MNLVLTQRSRPDRLEQFYKDNPSLISAIPFYAIEKEGMAPFESFCYSQHGMLKWFLENSNDSELNAFEDDCRLFCESAIFGPEVDLLYYGCNLGGRLPEISPWRGLMRIKWAWMSHAIYYTRKTVEFIVKNYDPSTKRMYDDWLSEQLPNLNAYVLNPMQAFQRPGKSELWGAMTDYTSTIEDGNKLMEEFL